MRFFPGFRGYHRSILGSAALDANKQLPQFTMRVPHPGKGRTISRVQATIPTRISVCNPKSKLAWIRHRLTLWPDSEMDIDIPTMKTLRNTRQA
jgi:hypothetical protein